MKNIHKSTRSFTARVAAAIAAISLAALVMPASAVLVNFAATGNLDGLPQSASAAFTTGNGTVSITLNNLIVNPTGVIQNISDLLFTISTGQNVGTIASSAGTELDVAADGSYVVGASVATGWSLTTSGPSLYLNVLGTLVGPGHTIIGTSSNGTYSGGTYSNANGSIAGNDPHNPFLESGVTFNLNVPGVTPTSTISAATFSFGTVGGNDIPGRLVPDSGMTLTLLGAALTGIEAFRRKFLKRS